MQILLVMGAELDRESTVMKTRKWLGAGNFSGEKAWPKEIPTRVPESSVESSAAAVEWAAIIGGALAAIGVTIILLALGPLGLATVSPWSFGPRRPRPSA
jgi:hypothetical protein